MSQKNIQKKVEQKQTENKQEKEKSDILKVSKESKDIKKKSKIDSADKTNTLRHKVRMASRFNKLRLKEKDLDGSKGIVYIGHLPKGFEEEEMKKFFSQFGKINKLRVSRSKKTGRSRGYAFLEFQEKQVAEIAISTMDNYMMFGKSIQCHLIEPQLAHHEMFKHGNREWKYIPNQVIFRNKKNSQELSMTEQEKANRVKGLLEKEKDRRMRIKELGIDYQFDGYQAIVDKIKAETQVKHVKEDKNNQIKDKKQKQSEQEEQKKEKPLKQKPEDKSESKKKSKK